MVYGLGMAKRESMRWRGVQLTGAGSPSGRWVYGLSVTADLEVSVYSTGPRADGGRHWMARVGLGRCSDLQDDPEAALDIALREHRAAGQRQEAEAGRQLEAFEDFLGLRD